MKTTATALSLALAAVMVAPTTTSLQGPAPKNKWKLTYEHDANGVALAGSLAELVQAVADGADIKLSLVIADQLFFTQIASVSTFVAGGVTHVACEAKAFSILLGSPSSPGIRPEPYDTYLRYDTLGNELNARSGIHTGNNHGHTIGKIGLRWWVRQ